MMIEVQGREGGKVLFHIRAGGMVQVVDFGKVYFMSFCQLTELTTFV